MILISAAVTTRGKYLFRKKRQHTALFGNCDDIKGVPRIFQWRGPRPRGGRPRAGVGFLGRGQKPPPHQLGSLGSTVISPSGVRGGPPKGFPLFSALRMASPDTIIFLIVEYHAPIGRSARPPWSPLYAPGR